ncbi:MAG TPA: TIR domain-containing protein [Anaerolineales bacterium]|nr:TIR domain-containing protein [Anaerolineales bacterium]
MGQVEKTVFISYRRTNLPWALNIYQYLTYHNYDAFFDYESIDSGDFEQVIIGNIKARAHFLLLLTPSALERCVNPDDWLRREIETAMDEKRNIIPLFLENFNFGSPSISKSLTGKLAQLKSYNGLNVHTDYFQEAMQRLCTRFLDVPLEAVLHPVPSAVQEIVAEQKIAANKAAQVKHEELSAQEWFEKGYVFQEANSLEEAIRCYTEAIRLRADFAEAYYNRGVARRAKGDSTGATQDYNEAVQYNPEYARSYVKPHTELQPVGCFPKLLAGIGSVLMLGGFGSFLYWVIGFIGLIFNSMNSSSEPDFSGLSFSLIPIGIAVFLVGMILFIVAGGMGVMRMFGKRRVK